MFVMNHHVASVAPHINVTVASFPVYIDFSLTFLAVKIFVKFAKINVNSSHVVMVVCG